jgi:hypothetical protein
MTYGHAALMFLIGACFASCFWAPSVMLFLIFFVGLSVFGIGLVYLTKYVERRNVIPH